MSSCSAATPQPQPYGSRVTHLPGLYATIHNDAKSVLRLTLGFKRLESRRAAASNVLSINLSRCTSQQRTQFVHIIHLISINILTVASLPLAHGPRGFRCSSPPSQFVL